MSENSISLYFGLKDGERADLEVVAAAAIQWVEVLRAAASAIDPEAQIRVELIDASESSLRLNTIFEWMEEQLAQIEEGAREFPRLKKLAIALVVFVVLEAGPTYDFYFGDPPKLSLSEEDRRRLDDLIKRAQEAPDLEIPKRKFYKTLERDPSIVEIGMSEGRGDRLVITVPSTEFAERSGLWAIMEDEQERTLHPVLDVTLIAPVLLSRPRSWSFQPEGLPEFNAVMRDKRFLKALEESHVRERLRTGIPMTIRLEVKEQKDGGDWVMKRGGRSVIEVISPKID